MPLGASKTVNYGAVEDGAGGAIPFVPSVTATRTITANTVVYSVTSNYITTPTFNFSFSGLAANPFTQSDTGSITLDASGNASITRNLDQTNIYADADFALDIKTYNDALLFTGANVELLGNVHQADLQFSNAGNVEVESLASGYLTYKIEGNTGITKIIATDPYASQSTLQYEIVSSGSGNKTALGISVFNNIIPGEGGNQKSATVSLSYIDQTVESNILIGAGGPATGGANSTINFNNSGGNFFTDTIAGASENLYTSVASRTQNYTTLYAARGAGPGAVGNFVSSNGNITAYGGAGTAGPNSAILGSPVAGNGGGGAIVHQIQSDQYTYSAVNGANGAGYYGAGAQGHATTQSNGNSGVAYLKFPFINGNYPVFA
tara:strand:+ start:50 stop:1183 length:1134 start_codon:yes stop_codon:yes gene_type:complete